MKPLTQPLYTIRLLAFALLLVLSWAQQGYTATIHWISSASGTWSDGRNWLGGSIPAPGDDVVITQPGVYTVSLDVNATINSLQLGNSTASAITLENNGQTLTIGNGGGTINMTGTLRFNAGTLTNSSHIAIVSGGQFLWNSGLINGGGSITSDGRITLDTTGIKILNDQTITMNADLLDWLDGAIHLNTSAYINILPNANFFIQSDNIIAGGTITLSGGTSTGILEKAAGSGTTTIASTLNNYGDVLVDSGTLALASGGTSIGSFTADSGAVLQFSSGAYLLDGVDFHGPGTIIVNSATLEAVLPGSLQVTSAQKRAHQSHKPQGRANSGAVTLNANAIMNLSTGGILNGDGYWQFDGTLNWEGGQISGAGGTTMSGALNIVGSGTKSLISRTLSLEGTTTWTGGNILPANNAIFNISEFAVFNIQSDDIFASGGIIELDGILNKNTTVGTTTINSILNSHDTINVNSGTLIFNNNGNHDTSFNIASGATLLFNAGTHTFNDSVMVGPGQVIADGAATVLTVPAGKTLATSSNLDFILVNGTLHGDGSWIVAALEWQNGNISGTGSFTLTGSLDWTTPALKTITERTLTFPSGTQATWQDGNLALASGAVLLFESGSNFNIQADKQLFSGGTVQIQGTLTKISGTGTTSIQSILNNQNTVNVSQGTLQLHNNGTHGSHFNIATGSVLQFSGGTHTLDNVSFVGGQVIVDGASTQLNVVANSTVSTNGVNFIFNGGTLTGAGDWDLSNLEWQNGTISGTGAMRMNGPLNISTSVTKLFDQRRIIVNHGQVATWIDGNLSPSNNAVLQIDPGATLDIQANRTFFSGGRLELLQGTLNKFSTGTTAIQSPVTADNGVINIHQGTLELTQNSTYTGGNVNITAPSANLNFVSGTHLLAGITLSGLGQVQVNGATLEVPSGQMTTTTNLKLILTSGLLTGAGDWILSGLQWQGGQISGDGAFTMQGALTFEGASTKTLDKRIITLPGSFTAAWLDGNIDLNNNAVLDVQAGATFDIQCNKTLFSGGQVTNAGTIQKTAGNGTTILDSPVTNIGLVSVRNGILNLNNSYTQTAGTTLIDHATLTSPIQPLVIQGGQLSGHGLIIGNITNQGELSPGLGAGSIGQLNIQGTYTQTAIGTLLIDLGGIDPGIDMDQVTISGITQLDGTLEVALVGGFSPVLGDDFALLDGATSGQFSTTHFPIPPANAVYQLTSMSPVILSLVGTGSHTLVVNSTDDVDDGQCDATHCSLREAIEFAEANTPFMDTIDLTGVNGTISLLSPLPTLTDAITIQGPGADLLAIDRNLLGHLFEIDSATNDQIFIIRNLALQRGSSAAANGGIIRIHSGDTVQITDSTLNSGQALKGGAIYNDGVLTLDQVTFSNNQAALEGGAVYNAGTLTLKNSTLSNNSASEAGGAICNGTLLGDSIITNSTFSGNTAAHGSAIGHEGHSLTLNNVTITNNTGTDHNGQEAALLDAIGNLIIKNSIVANNTPINCSGINSIGEFNLESGVECGFTGVNDVQNADPLLGSLQNNAGSTATHALLAGSPAIDAGNDAACATTDQRNVSRPQDGNGDGIAHCDMGAYELLPVAAVNTLDDLDDGVCDSHHCSLREAINAANGFTGMNDIRFNLSGLPPFIIQPQSPLPAITDSVVIDGQTQPGFTGTPIIQIEGSALSGNIDGLVINANDTILRGLSLTRFLNGVVFNGGSDNRLENCFIGTNTTGSASSLGNTSSGVVITGGANNVIHDNVIVNNANFGILLTDNASANQVTNNRIGLDVHDQALGNGQGGIAILNDAHHNTIGASNSSNRIAFNQGAGINIAGNNSIGNTVLYTNQIYNNAALGIDLGGDGVTPNDNAQDSDSGANGLQNYPVLTQAILTGNVTTLNATFHSTPSTAFELAFFQNATCDPSGFGEGQQFLLTTTITTDSNGNAPFQQGLPAMAVGTVITATATATVAPLNTSEFSPCIAVTQPQSADLQLTKTGPTSGLVNETLTYQLTITNHGPDTANNVVLTDSTSPIAVQFGTITQSQGQCSHGTSDVGCSLGSLAAGASATVTVELIPLAAGTLINQATVSAETPDPDAGNNQANVATSITEPATNHNPIAHNQAVNTNFETALAITLTGTDADNDPLTFILLTQPQQGLLNGAPPRLLYTPNADFSGQDSFTFKVNDGQADSAPATVQITVRPPAANHAPQALNLNLVTQVNTPVNMVLGGTDADGDALQFRLASSPAHGQLSGNLPTLTYQPDPLFAGLDQFGYVVNDGQIDSAVAIVIINVTNAPLVLESPPLPEGQVNAPYIFHWTLSGGTPPYTAQLTGLPAGLNFTPETLTLHGIPTEAGAFPLRLTITDQLGQTLTQDNTLIIRPGVTALTLLTTALPPGVVEVPYLQALAASGGQPPYQWTVLGLPEGLIATPQGILRGQPATAGIFTLTITVTDQAQQSVQTTLDLSIIQQGLAALTTQLPNILAHQAVDIPLVFTGGQPPYHCELAAGSTLPPDLVLQDCLGSLHGAVRQPGRYTFTIQATDSSQPPQQGIVNLALNVFPDTPIPAGEPPILDHTVKTLIVPDLSTSRPGAGFADESLENIASDLFGHRYIVGYAYNGKNYDIQLLQLDTQGNLLWKQAFDAGQQEYGYGLAINPYDQSVIVTGFGLVGNRYQAIILNYEPTGVLRWHKTLSETAVDALYAVVADATGLYAVGERYNGRDFDALITHFNRDGVLQWQTVYATAVNETAYSIDFTCTDNTKRETCSLLVAGAQGANARSGWVGRWSTQGALQTTQLISAMPVIALKALPSGDFVIGGTEAQNWRLQRFDATLTPVWQSIYGQSGDDLLRGIAIDREGFIYAAGRVFNGRNNDATVIALAPTGEVVTELLFDQGADERAYAIDIDAEGELFLAGQRQMGKNTEFLLLRVENGKSLAELSLE